VDAQIFLMHVKATAAGELTGLCLPGTRPDPSNPKIMKKVSFLMEQRRQGAFAFLANS